MFDIFINNIKYKINKNITVLQACEQANIKIPRFCYHEKLSVAGSCRMCLVEIEKSPKPVASCAMPVSNNMVIFTDTPLVKKAQESVLELLLINHPLDCPICDQGGECDLQDLTLNYGSDRTRFFEKKRGVEDKFCGPIVKTIMTRCIHCTRCVRFLSELAGVEVFGSIGRGDAMEIGTYINKYIKTEISGNLIDLCPVGALTSKPYAFLTRNWELKKYESIDFSDALCSNVVIYVKKNSLLNDKKVLNNTKNYILNPENLLQDNIIRILPKINEDINEVWISDKTRYCFDGVKYMRLINPIFKYNSSLYLWFDILNIFLKEFNFLIKKNKKILSNVGTIMSLNDLFFFSEFLKVFGQNNILINFKHFKLNVDLPKQYQFNTLIKNIENFNLILMVSINPRFEASMLNLKIRKIFFNQNININLIGVAKELTYNYNHLGISLKTLLDLSEGRHFFCRVLKKSKNPLLIFGSEYIYRLDSLLIQNLKNALSKNLYLNLKNKSNLNFVCSNLTQINYCELGLSSSINSFLYKNNFRDENQKDNLFIINNNDIDLKKNKIKNINYLASLNSHRYDNDIKFNYLFPLNTFFEQNNINSNINGLIQKNKKSISSFLFARNQDNIFKMLILLNKKNKIKFFKEKWFIKKNPFLKNTIKNRNNFFFNNFNYKENALKLYFSSFRILIENFYMTDNISKNSKTLAECTLFFKNTTNFIKIN